MSLLTDWAKWAERDWYEVSSAPGRGCYGTGYDRWGVQANQKYAGTMAFLAEHGPDPDRPWAQRRAEAALRYELETHRTGSARRADGSQWGGHWICALGLERMMHAMPWILASSRDEALRHGLKRVLLSEAAWIHDEMFGGRVKAGRWAFHENNKPESNLWNGAFLWRISQMYPDHERAEQFVERAHALLINAVSLAGDADDPTVVAGRAVRDWHVDANFFPNFALDHHGYFNVGYMVICNSNAAILHFDLEAQGYERPASLDHHQEGLWRVVRRMVFGDGRLARVGGDSRVPYTYCQEYLLPAALYAADRFGDGDARGLIDRQLELIRRESQANGDGSFYGRRLEKLAQASPYYYTRLETDRACGLALLLRYLPQVDRKIAEQGERAQEPADGGWSEPEYGAVLHRSPGRFASVAWRGFDWTQFLCQPTEDGSLTHWRSNLAGRVRALGDDGQALHRHQTITRRVETQAVTSFDGGFLAAARVTEGAAIDLHAGLKLRDLAVSDYAVAALPDGRSMLILHRCRANQRMYTEQVKGMLLNLANDLFNHGRRELETSAGSLTLRSPPAHDATLDLHSPWLCVDGKLGVAGFYGARSLQVVRHAERQGGRPPGLHVEEVCWSCLDRTAAWSPGQTLLDVGYGVVSQASASEVQAFHASASVTPPGAPDDWRQVSVTGRDGKRYRLTANFGDQSQSIDGRSLEAHGVTLEVGEASVDGDVAFRSIDELIPKPTGWPESGDH
jgi:hypothetical protein